jgi:hypothetical protein
MFGKSVKTHMDVEPVVVSAAVGAGFTLAKEIIARGEKFIAAATGHPGEDLGTVYGNYRFERRQNLQKIANDAGLILLGLDLSPVAGPQKIIEPIFEAASLEDDSGMQKIWANMLANAADPRHTTPVGPMFAGILKDLGVREVSFLDTLYADAIARAEHPNAFFSDVSRQPYSWEDFKALYDRIEIQEEGVNQNEAERRFWLMLDIIQMHNLIRMIYMTPMMGGQQSSMGLMRQYHLTELGDRFVAACRPPKAKE